MKLYCTRIIRSVVGISPLLFAGARGMLNDVLGHPDSDILSREEGRRLDGRREASCCRVSEKGERAGRRT